MYKFSRDIIFEVFEVNWPSAKFSSSKFHWLNLAVMCIVEGILKSLVIVKNKITKILDL